MSLSAWRRRLRALRLPRPDRPPEAPAGGERVARVPCAPSPEATIVIPAYGRLAATVRCLASVARARCRTPFEVVVVDDGSPDGELASLADVDGLRLVRLAENSGFVAACNRGAEEGRGAWLCFLNNDAVVTDDWLDELVATPAAWPDCGAVGAKLLQADGSLQEAGAIVWSDGSASHYCRGRHPGVPEAGFPRRVDYCSGACLLVGSRWFRDAGGFSEAFAPAYYEDVDLGFRLREQCGLEVYYQPRARVFHFEGTTAGTDPSRGVKRYQSVHRDTLRRTWSEVLRRQPDRGTSLVRARERAVAGRCLVVDAALPTPDRDAGSARMVHVLRSLKDQRYAVTVGGLGLDGSEERVEALERLGTEVLRRPFTRSWRSFLGASAGDVDAVVLARLGVFERLAPLVRRRLPGAVLIFDTVDLRSRRERSRAEHTGEAGLYRRAEVTADSEARAARRADVVLAVSDDEAAEIARRAPGARCLVAPTYYPPRRGPGFEERRDVLFVGGFRHAPNVDAAGWLLDEIWPRIAPRLPSAARLLIVGEAPPDAVERHAGDRVRILGPVADLDGLLDAVRVTVAPLRWGAGLKGKVHASLAAGVPCVGTPVAAEGLGVSPGVHMAVATDPDGLAAEVAGLYETAERWRRMAEAGRALVADRYPLSRLEEALAAAVSSGLARQRK